MRSPSRTVPALTTGLTLLAPLVLALGLALGLGLAPLPATAADSTPRGEALAGLAAAASSNRLAAVKRLGEVGLMGDADALIARLSDDDMEVRAAAAQAVWKVWGRTGDLKVDAMYRLAVEQMSRGELDEAIETLDVLIRHRPDFAEAWNKRATAYYLRGNFVRSLADCDKVFELNPRHFGALAGAAIIHARMNRPEKALELFKRALAVNPNMDDAPETIRVLEQQIAAKRGDMI